MSRRALLTTLDDPANAGFLALGRRSYIRSTRGSLNTGPAAKDTDVSVERDEVRAELSDPTTPPMRLMAIAQEHPSLGDEIAAHPNAYPDLIEWLNVYGAAAATYAAAEYEENDTDAVLAELAETSTSGARLAEIAAVRVDLHPQIAAHPKAYPDLLEWIASHEQRAPVVSETPAVHAASPAATGTSGWEKADKVLEGVGRAVNATANVVVKLWGIAIAIAAFALMSLAFSQGHAGFGFILLLIAAYGIYLVFPGDKWVIW